MRNIWTLCVCMLVAAMAFTACGRSAKEKLMAERDSLLNVNDKQRQSLDEMTSTIVEVSNILDTINMHERILFSPYGIEGQRYTRRQFIENIHIFENVLQENRMRINQLDSMLNKKDERISKLSYLVNYLYAELDKKDSIIKVLKEDVKNKNVNIRMLKDEITSINENMSQMEEKSSEMEEVIQQQEKKLHTVYYAIDTKKNLINKGILTGGKLFKKAKINYGAVDSALKEDARNLSVIDIYGSKPDVLSNMPSSSYRMTKISSKHYKLEILNSESFWSMCKLLVIQIK